MRFRLWQAAVAVALATVLAGCAGEVHLENMDAAALFARGQKAMTQKHWDNAIAAFDRLTLQYPSFSRVQEARFDLAQAYFGKKEYVTAAGEFDRLASDYPLGAYADHSRFMVCRSYEMLSPAVQLDQQYTQSAIDHCNSLISYYPSSPFLGQARDVVKRLTEKLARKELLAGDYYYRRHAYDSSLIYFQDVLKIYPGTNSAAQALLRMAQAYDALGYKEDAQAARQRLLREYPSSPAAKTVATTAQPHS